MLSQPRDLLTYNGVLFLPDFCSGFAGEGCVVGLDWGGGLAGFERPGRMSSAGNFQLEFLGCPYEVKELGCLGVCRAAYPGACIGLHGANLKTKLICLSCSVRDVQGTSYFCHFCKLDGSVVFFRHFSCCMKDKCTWSFDLCCGDRFTFLDGSHDILLGNFKFSFYGGV